MGEKQTVLRRLKAFYATNPKMVWAVGWVTVFPSLGSIITLNLLYNHPALFNEIEFLSWGFVAVYLIITTLLMGLALLPTTFLAILSGFVFGWASFPFLVLGYSMATIIGYQVGKRLDSGSLALLLDQYPKAAKLIEEKKDDISELIFFVRLSPVIPFALSNLLFALLRTGLAKVVWMGLWGMLPRTSMAFITGILGESLMDALEGDSGGKELWVIAVLLLVSIWGIYRFFTKRNAHSS
jgi:uncharacterized membrane protein YdjX (TVP38/TMEM64 family)